MANVGVYTDTNGRVTRISYTGNIADADLVVDETEVPDTSPDLLGVEGTSLFNVGGTLEYHPTGKKVAILNDDVAGLKTFMKERLERIFGEKETAPVDFDGNTYPAGLESQSRISGIIDVGEQVEAEGGTFEFDARDVNGTFHTLSLSELKSLRDAYLNQVNTARTNASSLESDIEAATTISDLEAIDVTAGW